VCVNMKVIMFYKLMFSVVILLDVCGNCYALSKTDPRVDGKYIDSVVSCVLHLIITLFFDT